MMEILLYFVFWSALILLMLRFGCGGHAMGRKRTRSTNGADRLSQDVGSLRWVAPLKDIDPVCKKTVATHSAKPSVFAGHVYYFCSRECREIFEAAPNLYRPGANPPELEHNHA